MMADTVGRVQEWSRAHRRSDIAAGTLADTERQAAAVRRRTVDKFVGMLAGTASGSSAGKTDKGSWESAVAVAVVGTSKTFEAVLHCQSVGAELRFRSEVSVGKSTVVAAAAEHIHTKTDASHEVRFPELNN